MNFETLSFTTFCVGSLADALNMSAGEVYSRLRSSGILSDYIIPSYDVLHTFSKEYNYIIPSYDVLHTFSKEYIVEDLIGYMKEKGVLP